MKRLLALVLVTGLFPTPLYALGLGKLELKSGLNEPFKATIELLSPTRDELDSLTIRLAEPEAFERAHIDRPFVLSQLKFDVEESDTGPDRVRVSSREAIREPFLNFLVEANWSGGRLYREYTVLLDPPLYDSGATAPRPRVAAAPTPSTAVPAAAEVPGPAAEGQVAAGAVAYTGGDYGPTAAGDTLWSIADRMRPNANVTVQQMMLALLRANPDAFIGNNVNGLRKGQVLHMPAPEDVASVAPADAFSQVKSQYAAWEQAAGAGAESVPTRAEGAEAAEPEAKPEAAAAPAPAVEPKSELKLVAPSKEGTGGTAASGAAAAGPAGGKLAESLALANEQIASLSQENVDLKDQLNESKTIVADLKRLIALKDDELAALQQKLAAGGAAPPAAAPAPAPGAAAKAEAAPAAAPQTETPKPAEAEKEKETAPAPTPKAERAAPAAKAAPAKPPAAPAQSLPDRVMAIVAANFRLIAMALGGLCAVIVAFIIVRFLAQRRRAAGEAAESVAMEFPEFKSSEAETILPGGEVGEEEELEVEKAAPEPAVVKAPPKPKAEAAPVAAPAAKPAAAKAAAAPEAAPPQEDPLAEVNVFLAYEHFDQAEEFVRDAIRREPDNLDFHVKLLEVLSAANLRKKYEEAAKVLHDKVNGSGAYWESALFYWDAMSPGRALFAAPVAGEEEARAPAAPTGGVLDLTAGESEQAGAADMSLDFDLGEATAAPVAAPAAEEEVLDVTAGSAPSGKAAQREDVLDVTAAVGLDSIEPSTPASAATADEGVLDISQSGGEDLLDVTAHADLEPSDLKEDLLDVTTATGAGADAEDLLAVPAEAAKAEPGGALDFDLDLGTGTAPEAAAPEAPAQAGNVIEFDGGAEKGGLDLEITAGGTSVAEEPSGGLELETGLGEQAATGSELSLEAPAEEGGLELEVGGGDSGALELEMPEGEEPGGSGAAAASLELEQAASGAGKPAPAEEAFELDLSIEEPAAAEPEVDMEGTVEVKKLGLELEGDEDEDEEDRTVFVPRTKDAQEQTAEDEIATKLDLAKAYVELGDKDSAKSILKEVIADGNAQQKKQAQDLMKQMS